MQGSQSMAAHVSPKTKKKKREEQNRQKLPTSVKNLELSPPQLQQNLT